VAVPWDADGLPDRGQRLRPAGGVAELAIGVADQDEDLGGDARRSADSYRANLSEWTSS